MLVQDENAISEVTITMLAQRDWVQATPPETSGVPEVLLAPNLYRKGKDFAT